MVWAMVCYYSLMIAVTAPHTLAHPHAALLELLRFSIDTLPPAFPAGRLKAFRQRLAHYQADGATPYEEIHATLSAVGKEGWPYRRAYEEIYDHYGRSSEESHLLTRLDRTVRAKYERFLAKGGKIAPLAAHRPDVSSMPRSASLSAAAPRFEEFFTTEEQYAVGRAIWAARQDARREIDDLILSDRKARYDVLVEEFTQKQRRMEQGIAELARLADASPKYRDRILDEATRLNEGWSVTNRGVDEEWVKESVEHWRGVVERFLEG